MSSGSCGQQPPVSYTNLVLLMSSKVLFELESVTRLVGRGALIFARIIGNTEFIVKPGLELHGCEILGGDIPRIVNDDGSQRLDCWGFQLKNSDDHAKFSVGDIVELSQ